MPPTSAPHVVLACSGLGHVQRGYERATAEMSLAMSNADVPHTVLAGGGPWWTEHRVRIPCPTRFGRLARLLGTDENTAYWREQLAFGLGVYAYLRTHRIPVVHTHDPMVLNTLWHARRRFGGRFAIVFCNGGGISPQHLARADLIHCLSPLAEKETLDFGYAPSRVCMVPYGVRPSSLRAPPPTHRPLRVVGVGALHVAKGVDVAVRAVALVPGAHLHFVGQPTPETPQMVGLAQQLLPGRAVLETVPSDQVPRVLAAADVFVLPTHAEGFGLAVLEAMSAGLPVLVSDLPIMRWLVGHAGILLPVHDHVAWADALASLTLEKRAQLGERARIRAAEFQWEALLPRYQAMFARAVS